MNKSIFDLLAERNEFPIVFIGSGISKRYLKEYPSWENLLEELWADANGSNFFAHLNKVKESILQNGITEESEIEFLVNTQVATEIESEINEKFYNEDLVIGGLDQKEAYRNKISPFKKLLANKFSQYEFIESYNDEYKEFKNMLMKAQIILTTNYDSFIEDSYNNVSKYGIKKYVGQQGFFKQTMGYAELYKIHGCTSEPSSLIINNTDYKKFDANSVLISAKIISMLLNSPIIFLGYSLTDRNVRKIIKDFTSSLNDEEKIELEKRLIVIQWQNGVQEIEEEVVIDQDLGCRLTVVRTDNYTEVFKQMSRINQGVAPSEVRRYQHVIRELIVERGKAGELKTMLVSPEQLENIEKIVGNKNIVVAIGDSKIIFNMPNVIDYIYDYIEGSNDQNKDTVLRFIATLTGNSILPILKYVTHTNIEESALHDKVKKKLRERLKKQAHLRVQMDALQCKAECEGFEEIIRGNFAKYKEYSLIAYNFDKIGMDRIKEYLLKEINEIKDKGEISVDTGLRRLALIYDLKKHGRG